MQLPLQKLMHQQAFPRHFCAFCLIFSLFPEISLQFLNNKLIRQTDIKNLPSFPPRQRDGNGLDKVEGGQWKEMEVKENNRTLKRQKCFLIWQLQPSQDLSLLNFKKCQVHPSSFWLKCPIQFLWVSLLFPTDGAVQIYGNNFTLQHAEGVECSILSAREKQILLHTQWDNKWDPQKQERRETSCHSMPWTFIIYLL